MKWKQWKLGAIVSVILAALCAGASWKTGMHWTDLIPVFCVACATHFGAYLKDHPTDQISFDTKPPLVDQHQGVFDRPPDPPK